MVAKKAAVAAVLEASYCINNTSKTCEVIHCWVTSDNNSASSSNINSTN